MRVRAPGLPTSTRTRSRSTSWATRPWRHFLAPRRRVRPRRIGRDVRLPLPAPAPRRPRCGDHARLDLIDAGLTRSASATAVAARGRRPVHSHSTTRWARGRRRADGTMLVGASPRPTSAAAAARPRTGSGSSATRTGVVRRPHPTFVSRHCPADRPRHIDRAPRRAGQASARPREPGAALRHQWPHRHVRAVPGWRTRCDGPADVVYLGVGQPGVLPSRHPRIYWAETVTAVGAQAGRPDPLGRLLPARSTGRCAHCRLATTSTRRCMSSRVSRSSRTSCFTLPYRVSARGPLPDLIRAVPPTSRRR